MSNWGKVLPAWPKWSTSNTASISRPGGSPIAASCSGTARRTDLNHPLARTDSPPHPYTTPWTLYATHDLT